MARKLFVVLEVHKTDVQEPNMIGVFDTDERAIDIAEALALCFPEFTYPVERVELNRLEVELNESDLKRLWNIRAKIKNKN